MESKKSNTEQIGGCQRRQGVCVCVRACVYDTGKGSQKIKTCHRKRGSGGV